MLVTTAKQEGEAAEAERFTEFIYKKFPPTRGGPGSQQETVLADSEQQLAEDDFLPGLRVEHVPSSPDSRIACLTAPAPESEVEILTFTPIDDIEHRSNVAGRMLGCLEKHVYRLRSTVSASDPVVQGLRAAIDAGDLKELARLGLDTKYAWVDELVSMLVTGAPFVEIETVGPYAIHHIDAEGRVDVSLSGMPPGEIAGLLLAQVLRDMCDGCTNVRFVSLLDDLASGDARGLGRRDPAFVRQQQDQYVEQIGRLLYQMGVLRSGDIPGKNFVLLRESALAGRVVELVDRLRSCGRGTVETTCKGDLVFRPSDSFLKQLALHSSRRVKEFARNGILLTKDGAPTCQAMDAAGFLNPINRHIVHVVALEAGFESQQDKTYTLLRAIDVVSQERYHNIFYDCAKLSPEQIVLAFCEFLTARVRSHIRSLSAYDSWDEFDSSEYVERNYGSRILAEDRDIIHFVIDELRSAKLPPDGVASVADIGAGPNLYPTMLLAPYIAPEGEIVQMEYATNTLEALKQSMRDELADERNRLWGKFEALMIELGGDRYRGALDRVHRNSSFINGSIFDLPRNAYDIVTSYFVAESITNSMYDFRVAIKSLARSLRQDGLLIVAHMVGSRGWYAGDGRFPAVELTVQAIEEAYRDADLTFTLRAVVGPKSEQVREGYHGMAVVVARRPT